MGRAIFLHTGKHPYHFSHIWHWIDISLLQFLRNCNGAHCFNQQLQILRNCCVSLTYKVMTILNEV